MAPQETKALGVYQSDLIIRSALIAGILDLRSSPWLLDYVFASLRYDQLTFVDYGTNEIDRAKEWFLRTNIHVLMSTKIDVANMPTVSIKLISSVEAKDSLGDVHYDTVEDIDYPVPGGWPALTNPFIPVYDQIGGKVTLTEDQTGLLVVAPNQVLVDSFGNIYPILSVIDDLNFYIKSGINTSLDNSVIKGSKPAFSLGLESAIFNERYQIGCHAAGESVYLTYLHSIISFILLRYRQRFLEARGFEVSAISSGDFSQNPNFENEIVFSRYISLDGTVRNYWPKDLVEKIQTIETQPRIIDGGVMAAGEENTVSWLGDEDAIGSNFK